MRKLLFLFIVIFVSYILGIASLKYNLFPIEALKNLKNTLSIKMYHSNDHLNFHTVYQFDVTKLSYYQLDDNGRLVIDNIRSSENEVFFVPDNRLYEYSDNFSPSDTAVLIMDAWEDSGTEFLNQQFTPVYHESILPLIQIFAKNNFKQFAFTNSNWIGGYGEKLFPEIETMIQEGKILKRYHRAGDVKSLKNELDVLGIKNLIYLGFASNRCIIGRRVGMFGMYQEGFKTYFVPEASLAIEQNHGWKNKEQHQFTTTLIRGNFPGTISKKSILLGLNSDNKSKILYE